MNQPCNLYKIFKNTNNKNYVKSSKLKYIDKNYELEFNTMTSEMDCTFQNDLCKWQNDKSRSSVEWSFNRLALNGLTDAQSKFNKHIH